MQTTSSRFGVASLCHRTPAVVLAVAVLAVAVLAVVVLATGAQTARGQDAPVQQPAPQGGSLQPEPALLQGVGPLVVREGEPTPARAPQVGSPAQAAPATPLRNPLDQPASAADSQQPASPASTADGDGQRSVLTQPAKKSPMIDDAVVPARAEATLDVVRSDDELLLPARLLQNALTPREEPPLQGQPMSLRDVVERVAGPQARIATINAYWQLAIRLAEYRGVVQDRQRLQQLPEPAAPAEQAMLDALRRSATARERAYRLAVVASQAELSERAGLLDNVAPLPADLPLTGAYQTNLARLFPSGAPRQLSRLDQMLPQELDVIRLRATAVLAAEQACEAALQAVQQDQLPLASLLETYRLQQQQQQEFLAAVRQYNEHVAQYALSVADPLLATDSVVSMLIPTPRNDRSILTPRDGVQQATAVQEIGKDSRGWSSAQDAAKASREPGRFPATVPATPIE